VPWLIRHPCAWLHIPSPEIFDNDHDNDADSDADYDNDP
jgi:hypothetical protein